MSKDMSIDRFNSNEDINNSSCPEYQEGYDARNNGVSIWDCPYPFNSFKNQIWKAGWADADMGIISDNEEV